jgi:glyoxylase-like metal-dependent hydrolase (beta-lactamase superfamily II)
MSTTRPKWQYTKGLHGLGNGLYAYLVPDGSWGWSNAGLIEDNGHSLLVDTLFDLPYTREMLAQMRKAVPAAKNIGALVNTHANGDHCFGNQLVEGARIIASNACVEDMKMRPPEQYQEWMANWRNMGVGGAFWYEVIGSRFDFSGIHLTMPTETFDGRMDLKVGDKDVQLIEVGPAHTRGDVLVYVPKDRAVYAGDIMFVGAHPAVWAGPVSNWIKACDRILGWDVDVVVPGHGPITDKAGVRHFRDYLVYLLAESRKSHEAGMSFEQATDKISNSLGSWASWGEVERLCVNVYACYREIIGESMPKPNVLEMLALMGKRHFAMKTADPGHAHEHSHAQQK